MVWVGKPRSYIPRTKRRPVLISQSQSREGSTKLADQDLALGTVDAAEGTWPHRKHRTQEDRPVLSNMTDLVKPRRKAMVEQS